MSVVEYNKDLNVAILNHRQYLEDVYASCTELIEDLLSSFEVKSPFRMNQEAENVAARIEQGIDILKPDKKKKKKKSERPIEDENILEEVSALKTKLSGLTEILEKHFPGTPSLSQIRENNASVRGRVKQYLQKIEEAFESVYSDSPHPEILQNDTETCEVSTFRPGGAGSRESTSSGHCSVLMPPHSKCYISDVVDLNSGMGEFDVVLMDPPWTNKHVKRTHTGDYKMLEDSFLVKHLPVDQLLAENGLLLTWCTNNSKHRDTVKKMMTAWKVKLLATWTWVKVTQYGELICNFSATKQPYEVLFIGQKLSDDDDNAMIVPDQLTIISVPSVVHSHKPPLTQLLKIIYQDNGAELSCQRKLEIFGRNLSPGWVTLGNQACLLNIISDNKH